MRRESGFSVMEALIAAGLLGMVAMLAARMTTSHISSLRFLGNKADTIDIKMQMQQVFANSDNCACQLNPDLTVDDSNDANLTFNPTITDGSQSLSLLRLKAGCALTSPVITANGAAISSDLFADRVEFADLRPTENPNEWNGVWRVRLRAARERISLAFLDVPQTVNIQQTGPNSAKIVSCKGPVSPGILAACPPGMAMIGPPNSIGTFCIHTNRQPATGLFQAKSACYNVGAGFGPGHLCDHNEWFAGCTDPSNAFADGTGVAEVVADFDGERYAVTAGRPGGGDGPGCRAVHWLEYAPPASQTAPYRCCLK